MDKNIMIAILAIFVVLLAWTVLRDYLARNKLEETNDLLAKEALKEKGINLGLLQEKNGLEQELQWYKDITGPGKQDQIEILRERIELLKRKGGNYLDLNRHFREPMGNYNVNWRELGSTAEEVDAMIKANQSSIEANPSG